MQNLGLLFKITSTKNFKKFLVLVIFFYFSVPVFSQKYELLKDLDSQVWTNPQYITPDSQVTRIVNENYSFFTSNTKYLTLLINYYCSRNDTLNIKKYVEILPFATKVYSTCYNMKYGNLVKNQHSENMLDSNMIKLVTIMFETEQNIRTFYKRKLGLSTVLPAMQMVDSLNWLIIDSLFIKKDYLPTESEISAELFLNLDIVLLHQSSLRKNDAELKIFNNFITILLERGIITNDSYGMMIDRQLEKKGLKGIYGKGINNVEKEDIIEINKNRAKIGLSILH